VAYVPLAGPGARVSYNGAYGTRLPYRGSSDRTRFQNFAK
jgi:hypothetical protein